MDAKTLGAQAAHPHYLEYGTVFLKEGDSPSSGHMQVAGLTKREHFASLAMQGLCADPSNHELFDDAVDMAENAVYIADSLLAALAKDQT